MKRGSQTFAAICWSAAVFGLGEPALAAGPSAPAAEFTAPAALAAASPTAGARPTPVDATAQTADPALVAPATPDQAAEAAYEAALAHYERGDIEAALTAMQQSFALSQHPELLYNLARLEREAQRCRASLADYRRYLERVPQGRYRQAAEQAVSELSEECASAADPETARTSAAPAVPARASSTPEPAPVRQAHLPYWTTPRIVAWTAISAGVASGGSAIYFMFSAKTARDDVAQSVERQVMGGAHWDEARQADQHRDLALARVLGGCAGALVAGGALTLLYSNSPAPGRPSASLLVMPGAIAAGYGGAF